MRLWTIATLACTLTSALGAQTSSLAGVDRVVNAEMARTKTPGVAIAIIQKGRVVVAKGYGYANVEHNVPTTVETIFQSGSLGKQFTAAGVMLLVEQGKIGLDDPLTKYFPDAPATWRGITVRNLLTHTSGIPDYEGATDTSVVIDLRRDYTEDDLQRFAYKLKLEFPAGSRWHYSNTGYVLLGIIVHKASGQFYGDFLRERVFAPLGMTTTRIISEEDIVPHRAAGYRLSAGVLKNQEWVAPKLNTTADGSLYLSINDLIAWEKGLRSGAILTAASWKMVNDPVTLTSGNRYPYGFGWFVDTVAGQQRLSHSGSWQGFTSFIARYRGDDLTIIVLTNSAAGSPTRIAEGSAGTYLPALMPRALTPIADREPEVRARLDSLLVQARDGRLSPTELAYVGAAYFPDAPRVFQGRLKDFGIVEHVVLVDHKRLGDDHIYTYELSNASRVLVVTMGIAPDNRISAFSVGQKLPPLP